MTIEDISIKVIEKLKLRPQELAKDQLCDYKSFWDEYKEQLQFQVDPSFDMYEEEVNHMAYDSIAEMVDEDILYTFSTIKESYNALRFVPSWEINADTYRPPASLTDKKNHIIETVLLHVQAYASSEEVEYKKPHIRYIKYVEQDITTIAEIIKRLNPWDYTAFTYSITKSLPVSEETINISEIRRYNRLSVITEDEFIKLKYSILADITESEREKIKKTVSQLAKILAKVKNKTPLEVIREMQYELEQRKLKSNNWNSE